MSSPDKYPHGEVKVLWYGAPSLYSNSYKQWRMEILKTHDFVKQEQIKSKILLYVVPKQ